MRGKHKGIDKKNPHDEKAKRDADTANDKREKQKRAPKTTVGTNTKVWKQHRKTEMELEKTIKG